MLLQLYLILTSSSSLTLEVRVVFFELYVHNGQTPVRLAMLSEDCCCINISSNKWFFHQTVLSNVAFHSTFYLLFQTDHSNWHQVSGVSAVRRTNKLNNMVDFRPFCQRKWNMVHLAIIQYKCIWVFTAFKLIFDKNLLHVLADNFSPGPAGLRHCSRGTSRIFFMQPFLHSFAWKDDERRHLLSYTITYINYSCCLGFAFCYCLCLGWDPLAIFGSLFSVDSPYSSVLNMGLSLRLFCQESL